MTCPRSTWGKVNGCAFTAVGRDELRHQRGRRTIPAVDNDKQGLWSLAQPGMHCDFLQEIVNINVLEDGDCVIEGTEVRVAEL